MKQYLLLLSTGRVHSSMLSGINLDSKSATVEWFENGETKGKEVCSKNRGHLQFLLSSRVSE